MSTLIVEVVKIEAVNKHPNANRLDLATVKGWQCVVGRDEFKAGDKCVYIPIDSVLPDDLEQRLFANTKMQRSNTRIKTVKIRGAVSEGLVTTLEKVGLDPGTKVGTDVKDKLKIIKYELPTKGTSIMINGKQATKKQTNPNFRKYTSIENYKNYSKLFELGEPVVVTEKIHGSNFRCGYVKRLVKWWQKPLIALRLINEYQFVFGSHNVQLQDKMLAKTYYEMNVYAEAVKKYNLKSLLEPGEVIYGEIYGDGIQKGYTYGCKAGERKLAIFDVMIEGKYINTKDMLKFCKNRDLPTVKVLFAGPFIYEAIKRMTEGNSAFEPSQRVREGVVIKSGEETYSYIGRKVLKLISDEYLLEKNNTEFH